LTIDGLAPAKILQPHSVEELAEALIGEKGSIAPAGARTQISFGNPLRRLDCAVDLTKLSRITEYIAADLTIHVEAGVTVDQLQHALAENKQYLPLDPWNGPSATIGGIAATNAQGPLRATGSIRDWIIGMKVVHVDGRISKTGGRVVKNVTGYDLAKLYTGSLGTLAVIAEISLKLRARFERTATVISRFASRKEAFEVLTAVRKSQLQPISCEWVGPENEVWLRFGEHSRAVDWQLKNLPEADWTVFEGPEEGAAWERLRRRYMELGPIVLRVVGLPGQLYQMLEECRPGAWIAHAMNGVALVAVSSSDQIAPIRTKHRTVIERAPLEVRRRVPTFGLTPAEYQLMRKLKDGFDPDGRLNPGRHVDGERNLEEEVIAAPVFPQ
jgi:glycolate oxidase FAD binding subunit